MCECAVCSYNRKYIKAVEENDKEFLMQHLDIFLNVCEDLELTRLRLEENNGKV